MTKMWSLKPLLIPTKIIRNLITSSERNKMKFLLIRGRLHFVLNSFLNQAISNFSRLMSIIELLVNDNMCLKPKNHYEFS